MPQLQELTDDEVYERMEKWDDRGLVLAHLKKVDAPKWAIPYQLYHAHENGLALLGHAGRAIPLQEGRPDTYIPALRLAIAVGRNVLDRRHWTDGYVGIPLLAAHMVARSYIAAVADLVGYEYTTRDAYASSHDRVPVITSLWDYTRSLWPTPATAQAPRDVHIAMRANRELSAFGLYDNVPGLRQFVSAGMNTDQNRYAAGIGHVLRRAIQDTSPQRREARGRALAELVTSAE